MTYQSIDLSVSDAGVATLALVQGERGNPFDATLCTELGHAASALSARDDVRSVLITAAGRFFSVGGDLRSLGADRAGLREFVAQATVGFHAAVSRLARLDAPVVCAVHGLAAGGGVSFAAGADIVLAGESAAFVAAYQGIGLAIDGGGSYFVPRRVGHGRAASFYLQSQTWSAADALSYGLVDEVVADAELADHALKLATKLAGGPTRAYGQVKTLLGSTWEQPLEAQLEREARAMDSAARTDDAWTGITAVASKQKPAFEGR